MTAHDLQQLSALSYRLIRLRDVYAFWDAARVVDALTARG